LSFPYQEEETGEDLVAKKTKRRTRKPWTRSLVAELRKHSKARTPVAKLERLLKKTEGALRQKARILGIPLGHRRRRKRA
jgi:hypothetical protein